MHVRKDKKSDQKCKISPQETTKRTNELKTSRNKEIIKRRN